MVGIVIVSHSRALAEAVCELAKQVSEKADIPIVPCGGAGDEHEDFGTDATEILEAIEQVASPEGVLVLMDLGSAVMSAETSLELLEADIPVRLCPASLVEGAVSAAIQAVMGSDLDTVYREAMNSLEPKREHLDDSAVGGNAGIADSAGGCIDSGRPAEKEKPPGSEEAFDPGEVSGVDEIREFTVKNPQGVHARPAAKLVKAVSSSGLEVKIAHANHPDHWGDAGSFNFLATLDIRRGDQFLLKVTGRRRGRQESARVSAEQDLREIFFKKIDTLVEDGFGESIPDASAAKSPAAITPASSEPTADGAQVNKPCRLLRISPGIAVAPLFKLDLELPEIPDTSAEDAETELDRLNTAREATARRIESARKELIRRGNPDEADILEAHLLILHDPEFRSSVEKLVREEKKNAALAVTEASRDISDSYARLSNEYMKARARDVETVARRLVFYILQSEAGVAPQDAAPKTSVPKEVPSQPREPSIIAAEDLDPASVLRIDQSLIKGFILGHLEANSHAAIIARSFGVPAVAGFGGISDLDFGVSIVVDADTPAVMVDPQPEQKKKYLEAERLWLNQVKELREAAALHARTKDGITISVYANIARPGEARALTDCGADGIGLLRTEFLFLDRQEAPSEEEQVESLSEIVAACEEHPVIIRLFDIGGDKQVPFLKINTEDNPFLGLRGVRLYRRHPAIIETHLRALLRTAAEGNVSLVLPMVTRPDEVRELRSTAEKVHETLSSEGVRHGWPVRIGIMVETPAAVEMADELAELCDFFSLGTNDLTQYILAADRGNEEVGYLYDSFNPAVLRGIRRTAESARKHGIPCGVCGEMAGDPGGARLLLGLGVSSLSVVPAAVPRIKALIRSSTLEELEDAATQRNI